jgi:hypothetical protein
VLKRADGKFALKRKTPGASPGREEEENEPEQLYYIANPLAPQACPQKRERRIMEGWIKLYRQILKSEVWTSTTPEQKIIFIALLLMANHEENKWIWQGKVFKVQPGQLITSLKSIAREAGSGISIRKVRTALEKFENCGILTNKSTKTGRLITIVNWGKFQGGDEKRANLQANNGQSVDKEVAPNKNVRMKECNNNNSGSQVSLSYNEAKEKINPETYSEMTGEFIDVYGLLDYFMDLYRLKMGREHKKMTLETWEKNISGLTYVNCPKLGYDFEGIEEDELKKMINIYFDQDFQAGCDYALPHFNAEAIKEYIFYKACPYVIETDKILNEEEERVKSII